MEQSKPKFKLSLNLLRKAQDAIKVIESDVRYEVLVGEKRKRVGWEQEIPEHFKPQWRSKVLTQPEELAVLENHIRNGGYFSVTLLTDYSVDGTDGRRVVLNPESVAYFKQHTKPSHNMTIHVNGLAYALPTQDRIDWLYELVSGERVAHGLPPYRGFKGQSVREEKVEMVSVKERKSKRKGK